MLRYMLNKSTSQSSLRLLEPLKGIYLNRYMLIKATSQIRVLFLKSKTGTLTVLHSIHLNLGTRWFIWIFRQSQNYGPRKFHNTVYAFQTSISRGHKCKIQIGMNFVRKYHKKVWMYVCSLKITLISISVGIYSWEMDEFLHDVPLSTQIPMDQREIIAV